MNEIITCDKVFKKFDENYVLKNISFDIYKGDCVALLGKNGAGKTTLIETILGRIEPYKGRVSMKYHGLKIGFLTQNTKFPDDVKVNEILKFVSSFSHNSMSNKEINSILNFSKTQLQQMAGNLSGGQKRILDFCLTIMNRPKLIIVDEPTSGMDTVTRKRFWNIMKDLKKNGVTILFTTHYVEEVDYVADRVLFLSNGSLVADDTPFHLRALDKKKTLVLDVFNNKNKLDDIKSLENELVKYLKINHNSDTIIWEFDDSNTKMILNKLVNSHIDISNIELKNSTLLDMIFNHNFEKEVK